MNIIDKYLEGLEIKASVYKHNYPDPNVFAPMESSDDDETGEEHLQKYDPRNASDQLDEDDRKLDTMSAKEQPPKTDTLSKPGTYQMPKGFIANPERQECVVKCTKIKDENERRKCLKKCG